MVAHTETSAARLTVVNGHPGPDGLQRMVMEARQCPAVPRAGGGPAPGTTGLRGSTIVVHSVLSCKELASAHLQIETSAIVQRDGLWSDSRHSRPVHACMSYQQRAVHLYRHSLKQLHSWSVRREVFYEEVSSGQESIVGKC